MKLLINYDFINAVKNANEDFTLNKLVRNRKGTWLKYNLPLLTGFELLLFGKDFMDYLPQGIAINVGATAFTEVLFYKVSGDQYKIDSQNNLKRLVSQFKDINVDTDYKLILESEEYNKITRIKLNEKKLPYILESKYILVPSYDYKGEVKDTSILQEHVYGSNEYVLSHGEPVKKLKYAYSSI